MLKKSMSLLILIGLISAANFSIFSQTRLSESKNVFLNLNERAPQLLDKDSFAKVDKDSLSAKTMQNAEKDAQKKKFAGIDTNTAIIIGAALAAVVIVILVAKGGNNQRSGQINCGNITTPCP
jgi:hypothetical protein